jgi:predicted TPR repeat methyltransferase
MLGGLLAEKAGNPKGALESMQRAVDMAPEWAPGLLEMALLLARLNQFEASIAFAEKVHQLEPHNPMVLAGTIDIAHRAGNLEMAIRLLRHGLTVVPNDPQLRELLANDLNGVQQHAEAAEIWTGLLLEQPDNTRALMGRMQAKLAEKDLPAAQVDAQALLALHPQDPVYAYFAELAHGRTPPRQPVQLNQQLFDGMASTYDMHMVRILRYQLPKLVAEKLIQSHPDKKLNVLDLGCGTGLLGVYLGHPDGAMVGVEISRKMIEQAARHNVYDKFHTVDLHDALSETPDALYDVITALDVFSYAGDLDHAIPHAHRLLVPGGQLVFSCEAAPEGDVDVMLTASGRYAHNKSHVQHLCEVSGFANIDIENTVVFHENGVPVQGFLVWARKAT